MEPHRGLLQPVGTTKIEPVRLAVIGAGLIGKRHAELVAAHGSCLLVGICDVDPSRRPIGEGLDVPFCQDIEELLERELPEGDIVTRHLDNLMTQGAAELGPEIEQDLRAYLGLGRPLHVRYAKWMWNLLHGDLGRSFQFFCGSAAVERQVEELIGDRILTTVVLTGFTILATWTFAIPIGIYSAIRQHSVGDYVFTFLGFSGLAVPDFLLGLVLMYVAFAYLDQAVGGLFSGAVKAAPWSMAKVHDLFKHLGSLPSF